MSKLLFVFERDMPTISITREMFINLNGYPMIESQFKYLIDITTSDIDSNDVIIFMRPNNIYCAAIAEKARRSGHTVVTFCDDDLLNLPRTSPTIPWRKKGLIKTLAHSDVIWSSSQYILKKYRKLTAGKRTAITDTIITQKDFYGINERKNSDTVRIVYAAAPSHAELFEKYIGPVIPKLSEEFGDKISFTFISVHPKVDGVKCKYLPGMSLLDYRKYMKQQHFDIGLAPLHNDEFSKCKYFNKFLEYTTQGVVGVYSKTEPYTYVIKDGVNGFLAEDTTDSWFSALSRAIRDSKLRDNCYKNAVDYVKMNHSEKACMERICEGIPEIIEVKITYNKCGNFVISKMIYYLLRPLDWIYLLGFYLKNTGIKAVLERSRRHFVEGKAYNKSCIKDG